MSTEAVDITNTGHNVSSPGNSTLGGEGVNGTGAGCTNISHISGQMKGSKFLDI